MSNNTTVSPSKAVSVLTAPKRTLREKWITGVASVVAIIATVILVICAVANAAWDVSTLRLLMGVCGGITMLCIAVLAYSHLVQGRLYRERERCANRLARYQAEEAERTAQLHAVLQQSQTTSNQDKAKMDAILRLSAVQAPSSSIGR